MEIKNIQEIIYKTVCEIQELSGRALPSSFCDTLVPIGDFEGFDSQNAIEVTVQLSETFGCAINDNPFVSGNKALTIEQIAQNILSKIHKKESKK